MDTSTKPTSGPRDFFIHLLGFGMLYASAVSLISLWFQYVNIKFPDPLLPTYLYGYEQLRVPMAALIVVFPVFILLARWISKEIALDPARKELRIYKWLVYFTLFVSAVTVIVDLITLIYNFLGGELTARFGLKILVVLIVALAIFGYYMWHLRSDIAATGKKRKTLTWIAALVVLGSIVLGFVFVGSPATARARRFDQQRANDLQNTQYQIISYWQLKRTLPASLGEIRNDISGYIAPTDPRTHAPYEYAIRSPLRFRLCATFEIDGLYPDPTKGRYAQPAMDFPGGANWDHSIGRTCFDRTIDPDLYPIQPQPIPLKY